MKLTGNLKKQVEEAAGREEKRSLIEQAGMELTDDELNQVSGGGGPEKKRFEKIKHQIRNEDNAPV